MTTTEHQRSAPGATMLVRRKFTRSPSVEKMMRICSQNYYILPAIVSLLFKSPNVLVQPAAEACTRCGAALGQLGRALSRRNLQRGQAAAERLLVHMAVGLVATQFFACAVYTVGLSAKAGFYFMIACLGLIVRIAVGVMHQRTAAPAVKIA